MSVWRVYPFFCNELNCLRPKAQEPVRFHGAVAMSMTGAMGNESDRSVPSLSDLPPTAFQTWSAVAVAAFVLVAFVAIAPFSGTPLGALNIFFPLLDAIVFVTDLVTAVLLFSQFAISGSRPLLALANGYLFTGLIVVPHALTFTGAFSPTGLLGANIQTGSWLFIFWHIGFAAALLAYALLTINKRAQPLLPGRAQSAIRWSMVGAIALTCSLTWLATAGTYLLPPIILDANRISPLVVYPIWLTILIAATAFAVLASRRRSVLDQWLMVLALIYIGELAFSGLLPSVRFSLGFYAGRVFSIIAASIVLIILLAETTRLHVLLARSHANLQREQDNKLMNFEAIVAAITHEIKQPLGVIELNSSSAQLILDQTPADVGEIQAIIGETRDAARRIDETLDSCRSLFGRFERKRQLVNMNDVILDVLKLSRTELSDHRILARTKLTTELPAIYGNGNQLHQLIYNLVHNAIEAMSEVASRDGMLEIRTDILDRNAIIVEVLDNGPGIDPRQVASVFEAFVTTKPHGIGLGLAICRKIVERHDGQISASSVRPHGTSFRIQLSSRSLL
jgi:signal transduction histidine kinase